jgi:hypothetical protein
MALGDLFEVIPTTFQGNQLGINVLYYLVYAQTGADLTPDEIAESFDGYFGPLYKALINNNAIYCGTSAQRLKPTLSPKGVGIAAAGNGTAGATSLPTAASGIIQKNTLLGGRRYSGRAYAPFPSASDDTGAGQPTAGYVTRLEALADALASVNVITIGAQSMSLDSVVRSAKYSLYTPISYCSVSALWATQRRRSAYGRPNIRPF